MFTFNKSIKGLIYISFFITLTVFIFTFTLLKSGDLLSGSTSTRSNVSKHYKMLYSGFPDDFLSLLNFIKEDGDSKKRYMWFPLNSAYYLFIPDKNYSSNFYLGTSFVNEYTGHRDYVGLMSLSQKNIGRDLKKGDASSLCKSIRDSNINFIIVDKNLLSADYRQNFLDYFAYEQDLDFINWQLSPNIYDKIIGQQIAEFKPGYQVFSVHDNLKNEPIEAYDNLQSFTGSSSTDWCSSNLRNKIDLISTYDASNTSYHFNLKLNKQDKVVIVLKEDMGMQYSLSLLPKTDLNIASITHSQEGNQFITTIIFLHPYTGELEGGFIKNPITKSIESKLLFTHVGLLLALLIYFAFIAWKNK